MMDPHDDRRAALVVLDNMEFPERMRRVERPRGEFGDVALQLGLADPAAEVASLDVTRDVEMRIVAPPDPVRAISTRLRKRRNASIRLARVVSSRSMSAGPARIKTPTMIIRLAGRSMRSQVVSTGSMSSLRAIVFARKDRDPTDYCGCNAKGK